MSEKIMEQLRKHRESLIRLKANAAFGKNLMIRIKQPDLLIQLLEDAENEIALLRRIVLGGGGEHKRRD